MSTRRAKNRFERSPCHRYGPVPTASNFCYDVLQPPPEAPPVGGRTRYEGGACRVKSMVTATRGQSAHSGVRGGRPPPGTSRARETFDGHQCVPVRSAASRPGIRAPGTHVTPGTWVPYAHRIGPVGTSHERYCFRDYAA
ncbi:hypothetical protein GCM10017557_12800 [Streptomyces aurantiacus]|uniref:Uncharacterized protein n=1 Tax=Streptomyces aurantiacus TaxID=47760 RepID=A0A7G1NVE1_9ACTN|nr:hypothetical protein GCM10017557_12800 [Streptomyces aurantiacus]